jgi:small subunit ribosomal protein S17
MKILTGKVVAKKMDSSAVVEVKSTATHPLYHKRISKTKRYLVHDLVGVKSGDMVKIVETRPISKLKKFKVMEVAK